MTETQDSAPVKTKTANLLTHAKDNGEVGAGSIAVVLAGLAEQFGIPVTPEMVAAGSCLLAAVGQRIKQA